jgi:phage terminase large subunit-like protein
MMTTYRFDERAAELAERFFERLLRHTKGEWAGEGFHLQAWQRQIVRDVFGWKRPDGTRRYRRVYIEIPRKNGKSTLSAGLALYLLFADGEPGAEVYSAAADREQAAIVFEQAKQMVLGSPALGRYAQAFKRAIVVNETMSSYKVLSSDAPTKHGLNAHGVIFDELHAQPNRELWDVLTTSQGSRRQPLVVAITTAGYDRESICWEQHEYARQVLSRVIEDDSFYGYIAAAEPEDDWTDPAVWAKANPSLGVTVSEEYLRAECDRARNVPAYQNTFRRLHLNQWTQQEERWLDLAAWEASAGPLEAKALEAELLGKLGYGGLDLASTTDIAALALVFPMENGAYGALLRFWIPRENMMERARRDRVPYDAWTRDGWITATPGNVIDFTRIVADVRELGKRYKIGEIAFDRWGAVQVSQELTNAGFTMVQFGQGFASMASPTKELLRLVLEGKLWHGNNPALRWMADNMTVAQDPAGNVKPDKAKSREKIDGMVALIMGLDRALRHENRPSVYEGRGLVVL